MQDRFKFRYVFTKDFGGKTGICYKMPIFNLDTITDENFNKIVKSYIDYDYKLISIEQCAGLKDKNGKLIYEKDIIKCSYCSEAAIGVVEWDSESMQFVLKIKEDFYSFNPKTILDKIEILGNIYETPELLEEN